MILINKQFCESISLFIFLGHALGHVLGHSEDFEVRSDTLPSLDDCLCFNNSISSASSSTSTTLIVSITTLATNTSSSTPATTTPSTTTISSSSTLTSTTTPAVSTTGTSSPACLSFGDSTVPLECPPDGQVGSITHNISFNLDAANPCTFTFESPRFSIQDKTYPNAKGPEGYLCIFKFTSTDPSRKINMGLKQDDFELPGERPSCVDDKLELAEVRVGGFTMCGTFNRDRNFTSMGATLTATFFVNQKEEGTRGNGFSFTVTSIPGT